MININENIKILKQAAINKSDFDNEKLKSEYKKILLMILAMLSELNIRYSISNNNINISSRQKMKSLLEVEKRLSKYKKKLESSQKNIINNSLKNIYIDAYDNHYDLLRFDRDDVKNKRSFSDDEINKIIQEKFHNKSLNKRIDDNTTFIFNKTYKVINDSLKNDKLLDDTVSDVDKIFSKTMGYIGYRLIMTEQTRIFNHAQNRVFDDFAIDYIQWCSALCRNTCEYCASMDGEIFTINNKPMIPAHSRCNCCWMPVF